MDKFLEKFDLASIFKIGAGVLLGLGALAVFFGSENEVPDSVIDITDDAVINDVTDATPEEVVTEE